MGRSKEGDEIEQVCGIRSEGQCVAKYFFVSAGQTRNMTPSYEVCDSVAVLQYQYF